MLTHFGVLQNVFGVMSRRDLREIHKDMAKDEKAEREWLKEHSKREKEPKTKSSYDDDKGAP